MFESKALAEGRALADGVDRRVRSHSLLESAARTKSAVSREVAGPLELAIVGLARYVRIHVILGTSFVDLHEDEQRREPGVQAAASRVVSQMSMRQL